MNFKNSKTSYSYRLVLNLSDKIDLKRSDKCVVLSNLSIYQTWKNIKNSYKNNKFKISCQIWSDRFDLSDESCYVSDMQYYFKYIIKTRETVTNDPPTR